MSLPFSPKMGPKASTWTSTYANLAQSWHSTDLPSRTKPPLAATGSSPLARIQQRPEALPPCLFKPDMKTSSKNEQIPAKPVCQLQFDPDKHDVNMKRSESCSTSQDATKQSATFIFSSPLCAGHSAPPTLVQQTARVLIKRWIFTHSISQHAII